MIDHLRRKATLMKLYTIIQPSCRSIHSTQRNGHSAYIPPRWTSNVSIHFGSQIKTFFLFDSKEVSPINSTCCLFLRVGCKLQGHRRNLTLPGISKFDF